MSDDHNSNAESTVTPASSAASLTSQLQAGEAELAQVAEAETPSLVQEIVNFLHRLFPGHGAPGTPTPTA